MKASINSLHHQAEDWGRELDFYKQELDILTTRLAEVVSKNTKEGVTARAEHFQNKFILLRERLNTVKHDLSVRENKITEAVKEKPEHTNEHFATNYDPIQADVKDLVHNVADTRFEFNKFLAEVL